MTYERKYWQFTKFTGKFLETLDKRDPLEIKPLSKNHASHVSKSLGKAIMRRSYKEKVYFKNCTENSSKIFNISVV